MAIQRWNPFKNLTPLDESMMRLFPHRFPGMPRMNPNLSLFGYHGGALQVDAFYTDESLVLRAAAPGFKADDVDLSISGNWLVMKGRKESEEKQYVMKEHGFNAFHRTMRLPRGLQPEMAEASFQDGILTITIPKSEETKAQVHKIDIKS